jgi:hypothetical protein
MGDRVISINWAFTSPGPQQAMTFTTGAITASPNSQGVVQLWNGTTSQAVNGSDASTENFVRIGHSLTAMILAFPGGWLAVGLLARRRRADTHEASAAAKPPAPEG